MNGVNLKQSTKIIQFTQRYRDFLTNIIETIFNKFKESPKFTGKIIIEINCKDGGIGNTEAYIKKEIK